MVYEGKKKRSRDHGIQVAPQHLENVAEGAQKSRHGQVEVIRLPRGSIKRKCNNLSFTRQIMSLDH